MREKLRQRFSTILQDIVCRTISNVVVDWGGIIFKVITVGEFIRHDGVDGHSLAFFVPDLVCQSLASLTRINCIVGGSKMIFNM